MKISKGFLALLSVILLSAAAFYSYIAIASKPEVAGGFKEGTEEYTGYTFARDNKLSSAAECSGANEFEELPPVSGQFMVGCESYFKRPSI